MSDNGPADEEGQEKEEAETKPVLEISLAYALKSPDGDAEGEGIAQLYKEKLMVLPKFGEVLSFPYRSLEGFSAADYKISIDSISRENLLLSGLGLRYEDFMHNLVKLRNELILKDMLMNEKMLQPVARGRYIFQDPTGKEIGGDCDLKAFTTALVILPDTGDLVRIPYSDISGFSAKDYSLEVATETGEKLLVNQMGRLFDPFVKTLSAANSELQQKVLNTLMKLLPLADPSELRRVARLAREGKAAKRSDIAAISPGLWDELEKRLKTVGIDSEYSFLNGLARKDKVCIGIKEGLEGKEDSQYVWFLVPLYGSPNFGNAIAIEASTQDGTGRATYFFRITGRRDYAKSSLDDLDKVCDALIKTINRAMIEINFRREPIYLSYDSLMEPKYQRYLFAAQKLQSLKTLRELFIGRVFHLGTDSWQADVRDLLGFNVTASGDSEKWVKNGQ
jgi:hypothetical protein